MTKREPKIYGSICQPGGRKLEITSQHSEWLDWATKTLYEAAEKESKTLAEIDFNQPIERVKLSGIDLL